MCVSVWIAVDIFVIGGNIPLKPEFNVLVV